MEIQNISGPDAMPVGTIETKGQIVTEVEQEVAEETIREDNKGKNIDSYA